MSNLQNFRSENWNVPPTGQLNSTNMPNLMTNTMPSLRSLATLGGGDAPPFTPRMRSPLFTISTRSITASHSELNVRYTTTEANLNQHRLLSETEIDESNSEIKAINSESPIQSYATSSNIHLKSRNVTEKERNYSPLRKCLHGSIEDLHQASNSTSVNDVKSKNKRKSAPNPSCRGQMIEAANELLVEENKHLTNTIQKTKRKLLVTKIATCFALEALKRRGKVIKKLETLNFEKKQQCAARLILHSLLLNSWRNTRRDLDLRLDDNAELRKSVENFTLQVQVLRHVQSNEKQKSQEKTNLIQHMNDELKIIKEENQIMRKEIEKMENELNSLQASTQNLTDENALLKREITSMIDRKDVLTQSLERERMKSDVFEKENKSMKETVLTIDAQLKETSEQKIHWQERARCSESQVWELQLHLESRDNNIKELTLTCDAFRDERMQLIDLKSQLKSNLDKTTFALKALGEKNEELKGTYEAVKAERDAKANTLHVLEETLEKTKKEFNEVEKELLSFKLQNVRRRREWGNALYFIVSPMDAMRKRLTSEMTH